MDPREELERLRRRKRNVSPAELHRLLTAVGFERRFAKGDHWKYKHPGYYRVLVIDPRRPLLVSYVVDAIRAIEEVLRE